MSSTPVQQQPRSATLDTLKGLSAIGVVITHSMPATAAGEIAVSWARHCVPIFIIIWAYLSFKQELSDRELRRYSIKKAIWLTIGFLLWSLFYQLTLGLKPASGITQYITTHWLGFGWSGQYFYIALISLSIFLPEIRRLALSKYGNPTIILTICLSVLFLISKSTSIWGLLNNRFPLFYLGYAVWGIRIASHSQNWIKPWAVYFALAGAIIEGILISRNDAPSYFRPMLFTSSCLIVAYTTLNFSHKAGQSWIARLPAIIGRHSMGVFILNPLILHIFSLTPPFNNNQTTSLASHLLWIPTVTLACLVTAALRQTPVRRVL